MARKFVPAIPDQTPVVEPRLWEINCRVTVFEDMEHQRMKPNRAHFFKAPMPGQMSLLEGAANG